MTLYEVIHNWGRVCLQCGSFRVRSSMLCKNCEGRLIQSAEMKSMAWPMRGGFVSGVSYFTWIPDHNRPLSLLIENLKGGRIEEAWQFWAEQIISKFPTELSTGLKIRNIKPVIVPAPGSKRSAKDHALAFAQSLEKATGWSLKNCLHKNTAKSQKGLGKMQRQLIEIVSDEKFSDAQPILFVDDVVTTGATAKAAYLALGKPKKFFVLALAYREI